MECVPVFGAPSASRLPWPAPDDWHRGDHSRRPTGRRSLELPPSGSAQNGWEKDGKNMGKISENIGNMEHDLFNYEFFVGWFLCSSFALRQSPRELASSWLEMGEATQIPPFLEI